MTPLQFFKLFIAVFLMVAGLPAPAADNSITLFPGNYSLDYFSGKALFEKNWVPPPSSTTASDGLGPLYNARSCNQCHPDAGRGSIANSLVLFIDDPVYGQQLQKYAVQGVPVEAEVQKTFYETNNEGINESGLAKSAFLIGKLHYGPLKNDAVSARLAPGLHGLALLDLIPESVLLANADEADSNGDGISGRVNRVINSNGEQTIGRFGWKAGQTTLSDQVGRALALDLGLGNPLFPASVGDCTAHQTTCLLLHNGNSPQHDNLEMNAIGLELLLTYVRELAAPALLNVDENLEGGSDLFNQVGCAACHLPAIELPESTIYPYTDLLLHDMGEGLADNLVEGSAAGGEWRTSPLWGLRGLKDEFLHDGRANTLHEAILWHGGEATAVRDTYLKLNGAERSDLIAFLNSL